MKRATSTHLFRALPWLAVCALLLYLVSPSLTQQGAKPPVEKATPGTIRGDFGLETQFNLVHGSDSVDSAKREIALWFPGV